MAKDFETLQSQMAAEMANGDLFERAAKYGRDYLGDSHARHVAPTAFDEAALNAFDVNVPEQGLAGEDVIDALHQLGSPGTVSQTGGRFFGLVNGSLIPASLGARLLADSWDQNAVLHATSPVNSKIEEVCQKWLIDLLGLPKQTVAGFVSGTSMAIVCGLAAARYRLCINKGWNVNQQGLAGAPNIRIVTSRHTHSTVLKAVALLGFGTDRIEFVDVDGQGRLDAQKLPELDDLTILILQAGNVNSGAFDPIRECTDKASAAGAWTHIDGAFGLWAAACDPLNHFTDGLEQAQSWSVDGHKTLNTPYDNGISLCADPEAMVKALQNSADYIMFSEHRDGMLYTPEMSRRARAIDLWAALAYLGRSGISQLIEGLHDRARQFATEMKKAGFNVRNDVVFNQVIIECGSQERTNKIIDHINASGEAWVGGSSWFGQPVIRVSVCSWATTPDDVSRTVTAFSKAGREVN